MNNACRFSALLFLKTAFLHYALKTACLFCTFCLVIVGFGLLHIAVTAVSSQLLTDCINQLAIEAVCSCRTSESQHPARPSRPTPRRLMCKSRGPVGSFLLRAVSRVGGWGSVRKYSLKVSVLCGFAILGWPYFRVKTGLGSLSAFTFGRDWVI